MKLNKRMARNGLFSVSLEELKAVIVMVSVQLATTGSNILYDIAVDEGVSIRVLILYRMLFATVFMVPLALITERNRRPKFTWMIAFEGFLSALLGATLSNNLYGQSLSLVSATFVTAMSNLIPGLTLLLALMFRLESLDIRTSAGKAKVLGTAVGIGGAMILTLVKGPEIKTWKSHVSLISPTQGETGQYNPVLGSILALLTSLSYSFWLVLQTRISRSYPCYSSTALMSFNAAIQSGVLVLCFESRSSLKLGWNYSFLAAAYLGIVSSGLSVVAMSWCTMIRGPLYVSCFSPLGLVFTAVAGSFCLQEKLYVGSLIGSILIIISLYVVIWGKSKETERSQTAASEGVRNGFTDANHADTATPPTRSTDNQANGI